ncbi:hypothetical protein CN558_19315 [Bacillus wiedmannii]|uniref:Uncharacterized protein n=1 Tax=Bacillus wiedmannii TaxID=1890302 RepID=A0A2B5JVW8_9BACI|nr:hypothetical protein [Bacillus wiedmannii]PEJ98162.1 hypothetical protein CN690_21485 [Bacillus wiedmannii]PEL84936.1 hypothetical protein CN609_02685 [Bacillus wiedmannii]PEM31379.1 hypothetical protein CN598_11460 [Bacillus wiedmannii]PEM86967.1 hypothetical protein CN627_17660 [Bacillus wiedmannii]PEO84168.1 hypothetical protein CN558_19315 [Bacillus wiedmannii]
MIITIMLHAQKLIESGDKKPAEALKETLNPRNEEAVKMVSCTWILKRKTPIKCRSFSLYESSKRYIIIF